MCSRKPSQKIFVATWNNTYYILSYPMCFSFYLYLFIFLYFILFYKEVMSYEIMYSYNQYF